MKKQEQIKLNKLKLDKLFSSQKVVLAYLFGSTARGTAGPLSDIDIAVLFDASVPGKSQDKRANLIAKQIKKLSCGAEADVVNLAEVKSILMRYQIVFGGELLYAKNKRRTFAFSANLMREYEDFRHLYDLQFRLMDERLRQGTFGTQKAASPYLSKYVAD